MFCFVKKVKKTCKKRSNNFFTIKKSNISSKSRKIDLTQKDASKYILQKNNNSVKVVENFLK